MGIGHPTLIGTVKVANPRRMGEADRRTTHGDKGPVTGPGRYPVVRGFLAGAASAGCCEQSL
jgi:hypothetical protein